MCDGQENCQESSSRFWSGLGAFTIAITLVAAKGNLARSAIVVLCAAGTLALVLAFWEHRWLRAPIPIGTPIKAPFLTALAVGTIALLGWYVWPNLSPPKSAQEELPDLRLTSPRGGAGYSALDDKTDVFLIVEMENRGFQTITHDWKLRIASPSVNTEVMFSRLPKRINGFNATGEFSDGDSIYEKAMKPIEKGVPIVGWAAFVIPGNITKRPELRKSRVATDLL
jgi:hypothetical protein